MLNDMTMDDVEIVEFPYPDDWYDKPEMLTPMDNPSELWLKRDHKHDLAFRPLEKALLAGIVDAIYTQSGPFQQLQEATGEIKAIEDLSRLPGLDAPGRQRPRRHHLHRRHGRASTPSSSSRFMKAMIKVGRWANEHKHAAAAILDKQTFYLDVEHTYRDIKNVDMVPSLSRAEPRLHRDRQGLHAQPRLHRERLRRARVGGAGVPREGRGSSSRRSGRSSAPASSRRRSSCRGMSLRLG